MKLGPVSFLFAVVIGWAAIRAGMLWPEHDTSPRPPRIAWQPPLIPAAAPPYPTALHGSARPTPRRAQPRHGSPSHHVAIVEEARPEPIAATALPIEAVPLSAPALPPRRQRGDRRLSISAWGIYRGESSGAPLATAGQLGGSQAGMRLRYDLGSGLALAGRLSGPLQSSRGKEAAIALDWRPLKTVPLTFTVERRAGLDRGGRGAFAVGVVGGFDAMRLPIGATLDGYAQAGVVGSKRRDAYADGALRLERVLAAPGRTRIGAGVGMWGGAQPRVSRLDLGPQLVIHAPIGPAGLRIGAEWRQRVAGHARPGSGPALSIGADF